MDNICNRIKEIINSKSVTTARFAEIIGVKQSTLSHTLNGRNNPSLDILLSISTTFPEISMDWLTKGEGNMISDGISISGNQLQSTTDTDMLSNTGIDLSDLDLASSSEKQERNDLEDFTSSQNTEDRFSNNDLSSNEDIDREIPWNTALYAGIPYEAIFQSLSANTSTCSTPPVETRPMSKPRKIMEVRVFFDDNTFESFSPNLFDNSDK